MSLISEALKKAQAQQQGHPSTVEPTAPQVAPEPPTARPVQPVVAPLPASETDDRRATSKSLVFLAIAGTAFAFMLGGGLIVWGMLNLSESRQESVTTLSSAKTMATPAPTSDPQPPNAAAQSPVPELQSPTAASLAPITFQVEDVASPPAATVASAQPAKIAPTTTNKAPPAETTVAVAQPTQVTTPTTPAAALPAATTPATPVQRPEIRSRVAGFQIRGIMQGGGKVLLYDPDIQRSRAFSTRDLVDANLNLSILSISAKELIFTDGQGAQYLKRF